ncbi:MAG: hypothetical protein JWO34_2310 [Arthrobacter sp.]|nr:hypothetical protein [Arthrobacter sp.]
MTVPGHVAQAKVAHEQVTQDKPSTQGRKEAAGHAMHGLAGALWGPVKR